jgi:aminoglycoside/choline kinase family phosphotransferase
MPEDLLFPAVQQSLDKYVELKQATDMQQLKAYLTEQLVYMLHYEMEKLMGILYRIDVREQHVKNAFAQHNPKLIAPLLAEAIVQRELEKAQSREEYRKK